MHDFTLIELNHETKINKLDCVYNDLPNSAKFNISFGFVLQIWNNSDKIWYYYAADNNPMFLNHLSSLMTQISVFSNRNWELTLFYKILLTSVQIWKKVSLCDKYPQFFLEMGSLKVLYHCKKVLPKQLVYFLCTGLRTI